MQHRINFQSAGGLSLAGVLHEPDAGTPRAWALFAHCFTCSKNVKAAVHIAESLQREGIAVLRFDFTGLGQSQGDFADSHFSSNVQDLLDAAAYLERERRAPEILVGHSLGGTAMLAAAHHIDSAVAVATIGSPADAQHILNLLEDDLQAIEENGEARVTLAGRAFHLRRDFVEDVRSQSVRDGIGKLRKALLVMHSPLDEIVPIEEASHIYRSALHPKSFISLEDADHLLSRRADSDYAGHVLAAWASRFIQAPEDALPPAAFKPDHVVISGRAEDGFRVAVNANGHPLWADEPEKYGGTNSGPSPYDFLSAALGTCTVMTLNMYARRKQLALENVRVDVRHGRVHAKDCADCVSEEGKIDHFDRLIHLEGDLTAEQRQRLLEIADRCPVHRSLHSEIKIRSKLSD